MKMVKTCQLGEHMYASRPGWWRPGQPATCWAPPITSCCPATRRRASPKSG